MKSQLLKGTRVRAECRQNSQTFSFFLSYNKKCSICGATPRTQLAFFWHIFAHPPQDPVVQLWMEMFSFIWEYLLLVFASDSSGILSINSADFLLYKSDLKNHPLIYSLIHINALLGFKYLPTYWLFQHQPLWHSQLTRKNWHSLGRSQIQGRSRKGGGLLLSQETELVLKFGTGENWRHHHKQPHLPGAPSRTLGSPAMTNMFSVTPCEGILQPRPETMPLMIYAHPGWTSVWRVGVGEYIFFYYYRIKTSEIQPK